MPENMGPAVHGYRTLGERDVATDTPLPVAFRGREHPGPRYKARYRYCWQRANGLPGFVLSTTTR
jgi:hypothetical protein